MDLVDELTGYRPLTAVIQPDLTHIFYETLALSRRELQAEIIGMLLATHRAWPGAEEVAVSVMRRARAENSAFAVGSGSFRNEVVTARVPSVEIEEYGTDEQALWELCVFTRWIFHTTGGMDLRLLRYPYVGKRGGAPS